MNGLGDREDISVNRGLLTTLENSGIQKEKKKAAHETETSTKYGTAVDSNAERWFRMVLFQRKWLASSNATEKRNTMKVTIATGNMLLNGKTQQLVPDSKELRKSILKNKLSQ